MPGYGLVALWSPPGGQRVVGCQVGGLDPLRDALAQRLAALEVRPGAASEPARTRLQLARIELDKLHLARVGHMLDEVWEARLAE